MSLVSVCSNLRVCLQPAQRRSLSAAALFKKETLSLSTTFYIPPLPPRPFLTLLLETPERVGVWIQAVVAVPSRRLSPGSDTAVVFVCFLNIFRGVFAVFHGCEKKKV